MRRNGLQFAVFLLRDKRLSLNFMGKNYRPLWRAGNFSAGLP